MADPEGFDENEGPDTVERGADVPPCPECGETSWAVIYSVTVSVAINEEGIDCVVVEDENVGPIQSVACRECDYRVDGEAARAHPAARVAEGSDWPEWEFGW